MLAVYKRELQGYFFSPIAYVFIGFFMLISGAMFAVNNLFNGSADYMSMLGSALFQFMLILPLSILTMRLLSEERKNKTDQLLLTSPVSITGMVMGKYLAAVTVMLVTLVTSFIFPLILFIYGNPSITTIVAGYLGFFLMTTSLIAVGVFMSSLSENQVTAAVTTFGVMLLLWFGGKAIFPMLQGGWIYSVLQWFSVFERYTTFSQGLLGITQILYYISFSAVFIFLTIRKIESRRWSEV